MHICIIGPGSVGLFLAAHLAQHEQVTLVGRNVTEVTKQMVRIVGMSGCQAEVNLSPHLVAADLLIVATKSIHLEAIIPLLKDCKSPVVFIQNGLGINHLTRAELPGVPLIRGLCWFGVVRDASYTVRCNGFSRIALGCLQGEIDLGILQKSLVKADLVADLVGDIDCAEWEKAMLNIAINGLCALTGERNGVVINSLHLHEILVQLVRETQTVAYAIGCNLDLEKSIISLAQTTARNVNSMLQDIEAGRATEIDYLNGYVMRLGSQIGINTPYNKTIYHLVKHIEARHLNEIS